MSIPSNITKPSSEDMWAGNKAHFIASLAAVGAYYTYPYALYYQPIWLLEGLLVYGCLRHTVIGLKHFYNDYRNRKAWAALQNRISSKTAPETPTFQQRKDAGLYDCNGAILGWDIEYHRPIFMPSGIPFRKSISSTGLGKTSSELLPGIFPSILKKGK